MGHLRFPISDGQCSVLERPETPFNSEDDSTKQPERAGLRLKQTRTAFIADTSLARFESPFLSQTVSPPAPHRLSRVDLRDRRVLRRFLSKTQKAILHEPVSGHLQADKKS